MTSAPGGVPSTPFFRPRICVVDGVEYEFDAMDNVADLDRSGLGLVWALLSSGVAIQEAGAHPSHQAAHSARLATESTNAPGNCAPRRLHGPSLKGMKSLRFRGDPGRFASGPCAEA